MEGRYEQREGNIRCECPACFFPLIVSAFIGPQDYICTTTGQPVTKHEVIESMKYRRLPDLKSN